MFLKYILIGVLCCAVNSKAVNFHYNSTYKYGETYTVCVNATDEYILEFAGDDQHFDNPARVSVASHSINASYPVFITARQQRGVLSWQLPLRVATSGRVEEFTNISRTLCPHNNIFNSGKDTCVRTSNTPIIHLSTSSPISIAVNITVESVTDFYVKLNTDRGTGDMANFNHTYNLTISPSEPKYYFFSFKQHDNLNLDVLNIQNKLSCNRELTDSEAQIKSLFEVQSGSDWLLRQDGVAGLDRSEQETAKEDAGWFSLFSRPKSVILRIESDDAICAVISIQNFSCPVFDNERDILYDGYYLTMTTRGGITLTEEQYPLGFYIVFIVKSSDEDCLTKVAAGASNLTRGLETYLNWRGDAAEPLNSGRVKSFKFAVVATISYREYAIAAGFMLLFFLAFYVAFLVKVWISDCRRRAVPAGEAEYEDLFAPSVPHDSSSSSALAAELNPPLEERRSASQDVMSPIECSSASDASELSILADADTDKDVYRFPSRLCLASLARKHTLVLRARSNLYTWGVLTVAVFYTLPAVQLVITYQMMLNQSGNQDLCYYNFLCAHPLGLLSDFNHVYSNVGYLMLGALFLVQVYRRERRDRNRELKELGIPQHFGLLYAMGIALLSEGLLSGSYHVCPNNMNFQFDTSFMYVTGVLSMVKIYQSRHPDINARAHATFGVLALIIFIGLLGVLSASIYFWVAFTILHLSTCFILTFKIYYMGRFKFGVGTLCRATRELLATPLAAVTPTYCARMVLLVLANLANWALAAYGMYQHQRDFASHLLTVLMGNLFLYTNFYIAMKLLCGERLRAHSWLFVLLTHATWYTSAYFFLQQSTSWALTGAQSRQYNQMCTLLEFYDAHDVWHFLSAVAMFFSFNMYLTMDDNLERTPRSDIHVF